MLIPNIYSTTTISIRHTVWWYPYAIAHSLMNRYFAVGAHPLQYREAVLCCKSRGIFVPIAAVFARPFHHMQVSFLCCHGTNTWFHTQPWARAHWSTSRCPPSAANAQVSASIVQLGSWCVPIWSLQGVHDVPHERKQYPYCERHLIVPTAICEGVHFFGCRS